MKLKILCGFFLLAYSHLSFAVLTYDESVSGDIFGVTTFALGVGTNTVTGTTSINSDPGDLYYLDTIDDGDYFDVYVPEGTVLSSVSIDIQLSSVDTNTASDIVFSLDIDIQCSYQNDGTDACNDISPYYDARYAHDVQTGDFSTTSYTLDQATDLPGGDYYMFWLLSGWGVQVSGDWPAPDDYLYAFYDYTVTFEVSEVTAPPPPSEVPLPAAIWLFVSGLAGLIGVSRKTVARDCRAAV